MAQIKNIKDSDFMETVRFHDSRDPLFYDFLNRPLVDMTERTADLDHILTPGRGLRVRAEIPTSLSIEIEPGFYCPGLIPAYYAGGTLGPIALAAATKIRIDLVYFDLEAGIPAIETGAEVVSADFAAVFAASRPPLPADPLHGALIPLAYLYVDQWMANNLNDQATINVAGCIRDARMAPGANRRVFASLGTEFRADLTGGGGGTSQKLPRADHRHPLNVDATLPTALVAGAGPGAAGADTIYDRADHVHAIAVATNTAEIKKDTASGVMPPAGAVGVSTNFPRSDHVHPLNYVTPFNLPATVGQYLAATGGAVGTDEYSAANHRHAVADSFPMMTMFTIDWSNDAAGTVKSTAAIGFTPRLALFYSGVSLDTNLIWDGHTHNAVSFGYLVLDSSGGVEGCGCVGFDEHGQNDWHHPCVHDFRSAPAATLYVGVNHVDIGHINYVQSVIAGAWSYQAWDVTAISPAGISVRYTEPAGGAHHAYGRQMIFVFGTL